MGLPIESSVLPSSLSDTGTFRVSPMPMTMFPISIPSISSYGMSCTVFPRSPTTSAQTIPRPFGTRIWQSSPTRAAGADALDEEPLDALDDTGELDGVHLLEDGGCTCRRRPLLPSLRPDGHELEDALLDLVEL